jgi:hypothetical protein
MEPLRIGFMTVIVILWALTLMGGVGQIHSNLDGIPDWDQLTCNITYLNDVANIYFIPIFVVSWVIKIVIVGFF